MTHDIEALAANVHDQWMATKRTSGITTRRSESGEELMVPYADLSEPQKEMDRVLVRTVLSALASVEAGPSRGASAPLAPEGFLRKLHQIVSCAEVLASMLKPAGHDGDDEEGCERDCRLCTHEQLMGAIEAVVANIDDEARHLSPQADAKANLARASHSLAPEGNNATSDGDREAVLGAMYDHLEDTAGAGPAADAVLSVLAARGRLVERYVPSGKSAGTTQQPPSLQQWNAARDVQLIQVRTDCAKPESIHDSGGGCGGGESLQFKVRDMHVLPEGAAMGDVARCASCGSTRGSWFDRTLDENGDMQTRCLDCGCIWREAAPEGATVGEDVKRYDLDQGSGYTPIAGMDTASDGDWVKYEDHERIVARAQAGWDGASRMLKQSEKELAETKAKLAAAEVLAAALGRALDVIDTRLCGLVIHYQWAQGIIDAGRAAIADTGKSGGEETK